VSANATLHVPYGALTRITQWGFNSQTPDADPITGTFTPSTGSGTVSAVGNMTLNNWDGGSTSDPASLGTDNSGRSLQGPNTTGTANKSAGFRFDVGTVGYKNIVVTWEQRSAARGCGYWRGQYTTNGTTWVDRIVVDRRAAWIAADGASYNFHSDDLSEVEGVKDNPNFAYRIVGEHESTATGLGSAAYVSADPDNTYLISGQARWEMVTVLGASR
jgi:hypothetical protein